MQNKQRIYQFIFSLFHGLNALFFCVLTISVVHIVFYFIHSFFLIDSPRTILSLFDLGIFGFFFIRLFLFLRNSFSSTASLIKTLPENEQVQADVIYNLIDIEKKESTSQLEQLYYNTHIEKISLTARVPFQRTHLFVMFSIILLNGFVFFLSENYWKFQKQLILKEQIDQSPIHLSPKHISVVQNRAIDISIKHSISDVTEIILHKTINSITEKEYISPSAQSFTFTHSEPGKGYIYLQLVSQLNGIVLSDSVYIRVIKDFKIVDHAVTIDFPNYTGKKNETVRNIYDITVLKGSKLYWNVRFNKPVDTIKANFPLKGSTFYTFSKRIYKPMQLNIIAKDHDSLSITYLSEKINVVNDQKPKIVLKSPVSDINISSMQPVPFFLSGYDDYGFSKVQIEYFIHNKVVDYKTPVSSETILKHQPALFQKMVSWKIDQLNLFPGMDI